jgi:hypothetical protein
MFCSSVPAHGLGVKGRILNKKAEPGATSRALGGPSCEHSNSTDSLTSPITVVAHGHKVPAVNLRAQWKLGVLPFMQFRLFYE